MVHGGELSLRLSSEAQAAVLQLLLYRSAAAHRPRGGRLSARTPHNVQHEASPALGSSAFPSQCL